MGIEILEEYANNRAGATGFAGSVPEIVSTRVLQSDAPAGTYVFPDAAESCDIPAAAADITDGNGGFLVYKDDKIATGTDSEWKADEYVKYVRRGYVVIKTEAAVVDMGDVYIRHTADGGLDQIGGGAAAAGTGLSLLPNAKYVGSHAAGTALVRRGD